MFRGTESCGKFFGAKYGESSKLSEMGLNCDLYVIYFEIAIVIIFFYGFFVFSRFLGILVFMVVGRNGKIERKLLKNIGFGPNDIIANDNPCDQCGNQCSQIVLN